MNMKIKITEPNLDAIQTVLDAVNGRAHAHTYNASEILALAQSAEAKLKSLRIPSRLRSGASFARRPPLCAARVTGS